MPNPSAATSSLTIINIILRLFLHFFILCLVLIIHYFLFGLLLSIVFPLFREAIFLIFVSKILSFPLIVILNMIIIWKKFRDWMVICYWPLAIILAFFIVFQGIIKIEKLYPKWDNHLWISLYENNLSPVCNFDIGNQRKCAWANEDFNDIIHSLSCTLIAEDICSLFKYPHATSEFSTLSVYLIRKDTKIDVKRQKIKNYLEIETKNKNPIICGERVNDNTIIYGSKNYIAVVEGCF